jgi:glycosyltransferase involved in cell wall biosynthesis
MQILIYTHGFPPMVGGIETITMELAKGLAGYAGTVPDDPVEVIVVTPKAEGSPHEADLPFRIVRKPDIMRLASLIRDADILHVAGADMLPLFLGWLFRKRVVVEHHVFQTVCPNGQMFYEPTQTPCPGHYMAGRHLQCLKCNAVGGVGHSVKSWLLTFPRRWLSTRARANVVPTRWLGTVLQLPNLVTIHHGLDAIKNPVTAEDADPRRIVFIGRLVSTKGVHILLQAVHQLRHLEFQLDIVGGGPERARLEEDVRVLGLEGRVVFRGSLVAEERERALAKAKLIVMPSLCETFGLVAIENMARKKALIFSAIGPLTEVIGDAGLTFPVGDATALAQCIERVLKSEDLTERFATRALQRATSLFTTEQMVGDHVTLYQKLLCAVPGNELQV